MPGSPAQNPRNQGWFSPGHLFEGYTKRGANDNMGGPAIQLEILRALHHLIESGQLPQPRRTIHFIWPNEISGTYEFLKRDPDLVEKLSININMDMVSEGLRNANSWFTMSETPAQLASYYDGLAQSVLNYVWRTNDIVYLSGVPRGRPGGQYFPDPMWAKNGSKDAFRFFIHEATGGSDHIVFNNASIGVPGIEFFTWPDQWYHADKDTPDKGDPTEMRRVAFIGASSAWASAALTDEMLPVLLDVVSDFGYRRVAERGIPMALEVLDEAAASGASGEAADAAVDQAWFRLSGALAREADALRSIHDIHSGSSGATAMVQGRLEEWNEGYGEGMRDFFLAAAESRGFSDAEIPTPTREERQSATVIPSLAPGIRGVETSLARFGPMMEWNQANPTTLQELGLGRGVTGQVLNFVNGSRSVSDILFRVRGVTGEDVTLDQVLGYLRILESVGWIQITGGTP